MKRLVARALASGGLVAMVAVVAPAPVAAVVHAPLQVAPGPVPAELGTIAPAVTSTNWSGWDTVSGPFTTVSGSWVQPTGVCTSTRTWAAFWVGLDGDGSNTVEQTGTDVDCAGGSPVYYAWYEMYPKAPITFSQPVHPGDQINASVTVAAGRYTLTIADATAGWTHTVHATLAGATNHSAEFIAEAPSGGSILPLTNFGQVQFSSATVDGQPLGTFSPRKLVMAKGGVVEARPGPLVAGSSFTDTWYHS
jgi:hypothetical protein